MSNFKPKKIIVNSKNRVIHISGRTVRTPCHHIVRSQERLDFFLKQLHLLNINDYTIEDVIKKKEPKPEVVKKSETSAYANRKKTENKKPSSTLEALVSEE